jgi:type IV pilus assembly protein PilP
MKRVLIMISLAGLLAGCGGEQYQDLRQFVKESGANMRGRVDPLPEVKPYEPFTYDAFELSDPFKPRSNQSADKGQGGTAGPAPDQSRRKEALEGYPLESLKMVGTLQDKTKKMFALIKTPDNNIYQVKGGNYLGQNFGVISMITETSITLKEVIQDTAGVWTERTSSLQLLDEEESKK